MSTMYFPCCAELSASHVFFLWYTDDVDGTVCESGDLVTFSSLQECIDYAETRGLVLGARDATLYDIRALDRWKQNPEETAIDPPALLNLWNLLEDYLRSRNDDGDSFPIGEHELYDKLFYANNLPSITPPGQRFHPKWTRVDQGRIAGALKQPLSEFCRSLQQ